LVVGNNSFSGNCNVRCHLACVKVNNEGVVGKEEGVVLRRDPAGYEVGSSIFIEFFLSMMSPTIPIVVYQTLYTWI